MLITAIYLIALMIAPQLWIEPFKGMRVDLFIYPAWMVYVLASGKMKNFKLTHGDWFFVLMIVWIVLSSYVNGMNAKSGDIIQNYIKWFLMYKMVSMTVSNVNDVRKVSYILIVLGMVMTMEGIQHKLSPDGIGWAGQALGWVDPQVLREGGTGRTQWINIFDGPGVFCVLYTTVLPFLLIYIGKPYSGAKRLLALALSAVMLLAIFYTGSRGGFLATLAIFGFFMANKLKISLIRLAIVGGVLFVAFMLAPSYLTSMRDSNKSAQHRVDMWGEGVEMVEQNPVFGIGKGNFANYTGRLIAHNSSIEVMGETGVPGFFFWLALLYVSIKYLHQYYQQAANKEDQMLALGLAISIGGYMVSSMFVTLEYETLYFLLGLSAAFGRFTRREKGETETVTVADGKQEASVVPIMVAKDYYRIFGMMAGWIVLLKLFIRAYF